jgi:hypothetical protein
MNQKNISPTTDHLSYKYPIFILGITPRSGTNFLFDLLRLHPEIAPPEPIWEDFLLHHIDLLDTYIKEVKKRWDPKWGIIGIEELLYTSLGDSLISFLNLLVKNKNIVTKTPSVNNLNMFFKFFSHSKLLILVRDGRSVVESGVKSGFWSYEEGMRKWSEAAKKILKFKITAKAKSGDYLIVKFEELVNNTEDEIIKIFNFLNLEFKGYNLKAAKNLPVKGSSILRGPYKTLNWKPISKTKEFNPTIRWKQWNWKLHERFNWVAGSASEQFGYEKKVYIKNRFLSGLYNKILDMLWNLKIFVKIIYKSILNKFKR